MKIYLSGPITGVPDYRERFQSVADKLTAAGHIVLNPAVLPGGLERVDYMRICFAMLEAADMMVLLEGSGHSTGAGAEYAYCLATGKQARPAWRMQDLIEGNQ